MPDADRFETSLKRYDPLLSLRWGPFVQAWVVDRKAPKGISKPLWDTLEWATQQPDCEPIDRERLLSAKAGNRPVIHTKNLGNHVFDALWRDDLQVHGTKVVDRHMAGIEKERERKKQGSLGPDAGKMAVEGIDFLNRRRASPTPEQQKEVFQEVMDGRPAPKLPVADVTKQIGELPKWMKKKAVEVSK